MHDFRSDTVTLPTPAMMAAVAAARLGDAARGDDPTVAELERLAATLTGKDDALFLPSGTMANLAALIAHGCRGGEVIVEQAAHIFNSEGGGLSVLAGAVPRAIKGERGLLAPGDVEQAIRGAADLALAPTRLICLENTHNAAGGTVMAPATMAAIHSVAQRAGLPVHLDGARLFNAAAFLETSIGELCCHVDSVWFALCKGLGGPVGAILAGDRDFMLKARRAVRLLGGGMRQAGLIAAGALYALRHHRDRLAEDHANARALAEGLARIPGVELDPETVTTNIVRFRIPGADAPAMAKRLQAHGVALFGNKPDSFRAVTHLMISPEDVMAAVKVFEEALAP